MLRGGHIAEVLGTVHRAVGDLELQIPEPTQGAFGPGAMYDFFRAMNQVLAGRIFAEKSLTRSRIVSGGRTEEK